MHTSPQDELFFLNNTPPYFKLIIFGESNTFYVSLPTREDLSFMTHDENLSLLNRFLFLYHELCPRFITTVDDIILPPSPPQSAISNDKATKAKTLPRTKHQRRHSLSSSLRQLIDSITPQYFEKRRNSLLIDKMVQEELRNPSPQHATSLREIATDLHTDPYQSRTHTLRKTTSNYEISTICLPQSHKQKDDAASVPNHATAMKKSCSSHTINQKRYPTPSHHRSSSFSNTKFRNTLDHIGKSMQNLASHFSSK